MTPWCGILPGKVLHDRFLFCERNLDLTIETFTNRVLLFFCYVCFWVRWGCLPWWFAYRWVSDPLLDWCHIFAQAILAQVAIAQSRFAILLVGAQPVGVHTGWVVPKRPCQRLSVPASLVRWGAWHISLVALIGDGCNFCVTLMRENILDGSSVSYEGCWKWSLSWSHNGGHSFA